MVGYMTALKGKTIVTRYRLGRVQRFREHEVPTLLCILSVVVDT